MAIKFAVGLLLGKGREPPNLDKGPGGGVADRCGSYEDVNSLPDNLGKITSAHLTSKGVYGIAATVDVKQYKIASLVLFYKKNDKWLGGVVDYMSANGDYLRDHRDLDNWAPWPAFAKKLYNSFKNGTVSEIQICITDKSYKNAGPNGPNEKRTKWFNLPKPS